MKFLRLRVAVDVRVPDDFSWATVEPSEVVVNVQSVTMTDGRGRHFACVPDAAKAREITIRPRNK